MESKTIKIVVYHCRNLQLFTGGEQKDFQRSRPGIKLVAIPCSGKIEAHHLLKTLAGGAQGVLVLACAKQACQFLEGSMRSDKRVEYARSWLAELELEPEGLEYAHVPPRDVAALDSILKEFTSKLESFGTIPAAVNF